MVKIKDLTVSLIKLQAPPNPNVVVDKLHDLPGSLFPQLQGMNNSNSYLVRLLWKLNKMMYVKPFTQCWHTENAHEISAMTANLRLIVL